MKIRNILYCCLALFSSSATTWGTIFIDDFTTPQLVSSNGSVGGSGIVGQNVNGAGILGGQRFVYSEGPLVNINSAVPNQLQLSIPQGSQSGWAYLFYDGGYATTTGGGLADGLGDVDLTQGGLNTCFQLDITSEHNLGGLLQIVVGNSGFAYSSIELPMPQSPGIFQIPFADFAATGSSPIHPVNFADVGSVTVDFTLSPGESYTISSFSATSVPEPSVLSLMLLSGLGLIYRIKSRRTQRCSP